MRLAGVLVLFSAARAQRSLLEDGRKFGAVADGVSEHPGDAKVAPAKPGVACTEAVQAVQLAIGQGRSQEGLAASDAMPVRRRDITAWDPDQVLSPRALLTQRRQ